MNDRNHEFNIPGLDKALPFPGIVASGPFKQHEIEDMMNSFPLTEAQQVAISVFSDDMQNIHATSNALTELLNVPSIDLALERLISLGNIEPDIIKKGPMRLLSGLGLPISTQFAIAARNLVNNGMAPFDFCRSVDERVATYLIARNVEAKRMSKKAFDDSTISELLKISREIGDDEPADKNRMFLFGHALMNVKSLQAIYNKMEVRTGKESKRLGELQLVNEGLFTATKELQKYGLKSVFVRDGTALPIADWHVYDHTNMVREATLDAGLTVKPRAATHHSIARFSAFRSPLKNDMPSYAKKVVPDMEYIWGTREEGGLGNEVTIMSYGGLVQGNEEQELPDFTIDLYPDGHLYFSYGSSVKEFSDELGNGLEYELLRSRLLSIYADMVVPSYMIDGSETIRQAEAAAGSASRAKTANFLQLALARLKVILESSDLSEAIEKEERDSKVMRRHGVEGFIRKLPLGQRASQYAREQCLKDQDILLPINGETYVRKHFRGGEQIDRDDSGHVDAHRARMRHMGGTAVIKSIKDTQGLIE